MKYVNTDYRSAGSLTAGTDVFRGVDLYNSPANVSITRSPDAPNMIRDVPGKVRKRMGYHRTASYDGRINGIFLLHLPAGDVELVHAGTRLYKGAEVLYGGMKDARSSAWQFGGRLYILDGQTYVWSDGTAAGPVTSIAYSPKLVIGRAPSGGGTQYERLNLLCSAWTESFLSDGTSNIYQLSFDGLDEGSAEVSVMTAADEWTAKTAGTDYTFNAALGTVTFLPGAVPGASPVDGADNVRIRAAKTRADYAARINGCDLGAQYGVSAAADRLFVTGNPDYVNWDWVSGLDDPTYFPVTAYAALGMRTRITAYSVVDGKLAAHKAQDEDGRSIILRAGKAADDGTASFPVVGTMQGACCVSAHSVVYLQSEPLYLAEDGIYAITPADVSAERYAQNRSMFINSALKAQTDKADAAAVRFGDFYVLALGGKLYLLDSLVKAYADGAPYSTHQYEAYVFPDIPARVLCVRDGRLRFGTAGGGIMEFYTDRDAPQSYADDGAPIAAHWDTPLLCGTSFYRLKNFRYLALRLFSGAATGIRVSVQKNGLWETLFEETARLRYFSFAAPDFRNFSFSTDPTPKCFGKRIRAAKQDKIRFRFENSAYGQPLGLFDFSVEYTQSGKIK
ncbi:MAG: hypothetical protein VB021_09945 [Oscillospiraceae bacterium]|nr:hypothetical protein [Oscillospiraceae bacterium]